MNKNKIINYYKNYHISINAILVMFLILVYYLYISTLNVPVMDYWRYLNEIGEKIFDNTLTFRDVWKNVGVQRNPLIYTLFAVNIKYFNYNTQIEIFLGALILAINSFIIFDRYRKTTLKLNIENKNNIEFLFIPILFAIFNLNQWEILTLEFSLAFMLRIMMYLIIFIKVDELLLGEKTEFKNVISICIILFFTICFMSQGYFPALVGSIILVVCIDLIFYNKSFKYLKIKYILFISIAIVLSFIVYLYGITPSNDESISFKEILKFILDGEFFKGFILMLGASILNVGLITNIKNISLFYIVGSIVFIISVYSIYIYFRRGINKKSYLPIMLILYSFINIALIIYARIHVFDLVYIISSRYTVETTIGILGVLLILAYNILTYKSKNDKKDKPIFNKYLFFMMIITIFLLYTGLTEIKTGPYRKLYGDGLVKIMVDIENYEDSELTPFQATEEHMVRDGVELMKKYELGIFRK